MSELNEQLLDIARRTGLRAYLHGVNATDARELLGAFVAELDKQRAAPAPAQQEEGDVSQENARDAYTTGYAYLCCGEHTPCIGECAVSAQGAPADARDAALDPVVIYEAIRGKKFTTTAQSWELVDEVIAAIASATTSTEGR